MGFGGRARMSNAHCRRHGLGPTARRRHRDQEPKTSRSRRHVICAHVAVEALRSDRSAQAAERLAAGDAWVGHDLVFANRTGGFLEVAEPPSTRVLPLARPSGIAADSIPRPSAHGGDPHASARCPPADRGRPPRPRQPVPDPRPARACDRGDASPGGPGNGYPSSAGPSAAAAPRCSWKGAAVRWRCCHPRCQGGSVPKKPVPPAGIELATRGLGIRFRPSVWCHPVLFCSSDWAAQSV